MTHQELHKEIIKHRRYLHAHPELGHQEYMTQAYIIEHLEKLGLEYNKVNTSTICDLIVDPEFEMIAMRADIDALALVEENECDYKSKHHGVMHACGHDAHTAIQLGVISYFAVNQEELKVNIRFIFQCDEESNGGAEEICAAGYLDGIKYVYGLHVDNDLPVGSIGYIYGQMNAGGDEVDIIVTGSQAHGAYPQKGVDSIVCSANIIMSAQQIVSRQVGPLDSTVVTIGTIDGPGTPNTICGQVKMRGTIRNLNPQTRVATVEQFIKQTKLIGEAMGCSVEVIHEPSYPPLVNHDEHVDYVIATAKKLGYNPVNKKYPTMGLEDFAYYVEKVPGAFFNVGSQLPGDYRPAHNGKFDIDEDALLVGALMQIENAKGIN